MEDNKSGYSALTDIHESAQKDKRARRLTEKFGFNDEYAAYNIKDIADKAGFIGMIASLVFGFWIWIRLDDVVGLLVGLIIAAAGIFASYVLMSILYSYGDMVANSIEQTKILKILEAQRISDLLKADQEEAKKQQAATAQGINQGENTSSEAGADFSEEDLENEEFNTSESEDFENINIIAKLPLIGVIDSKMRRVAHYTERSSHGIICPVCGRKQDSDRNNCFFCDCRFLYDDEPFSANDDILLERLRHM